MPQCLGKYVNVSYFFSGDSLNFIRRRFGTLYMKMVQNVPKCRHIKFRIYTPVRTVGIPDKIWTRIFQNTSQELYRLRHSAGLMFKQLRKLLSTLASEMKQLKNSYVQCQLFYCTESWAKVEGIPALSFLISCTYSFPAVEEFSNKCWYRQQGNCFKINFLLTQLERNFMNFSQNFAKLNDYELPLIYV